MLIGYMRVSKADGSQSTDLQRDALRAAGVATRRLYEDRASVLNAKLSATESPTLFATVQNLALSGFVSPAGGCAMQTSIRGSLGTLVL